jgi:hypothetical protein
VVGPVYASDGMNRRVQGLSLSLLLLALAACQGNEKPSGDAPAAASAAAPLASASATPTAAASATGAPAADSICKKKGLEGDGTFFKPCTLKTPVLTATWTGKIVDEGAVFDVDNAWPEKIDWATVAVYYYDKADKQLEAETKDKRKFKRHYASGGIFKDLTGKMVILAPGKSQVVLGFKKADMPKDVAAIEVEVMGLGWDERVGQNGEAFFRYEGAFPEERPRGGLK